MKIVNIIEDTTENNELFAEHGLCFYVETEKHKMLIDVSKLSKLLLKDRANISRILNILEKKKLILKKMSQKICQKMHRKMQKN